MGESRPSDETWGAARITLGGELAAAVGELTPQRERATLIRSQCRAKTEDQQP